MLAVSCKTGELELVGVFHAGDLQGSALNVVVGIDQLRDLMTTRKRTPRRHGEVNASLDEPSRGRLARQSASVTLPFFPFGNLSAPVRPSADGGLVFELSMSAEICGRRERLWEEREKEVAASRPFPPKPAGAASTSPRLPADASRAPSSSARPKGTPSIGTRSECWASRSTTFAQLGSSLGVA